MYCGMFTWAIIGLPFVFCIGNSPCTISPSAFASKARAAYRRREKGLIDDYAIR